MRLTVPDLEPQHLSLTYRTNPQQFKQGVGWSGVLNTELRVRDSDKYFVFILRHLCSLVALLQRDWACCFRLQYSELWSCKLCRQQNIKVPSRWIYIVDTTVSLRLFITRRCALHVSTSSGSLSGVLQEKIEILYGVVLIWIHILEFIIIIIIIIIGNTPFGDCELIYVKF
jgi:hypothetical protein